MTTQSFEIRNPLVIIFKNEAGTITTHIHPSDYEVPHYGLLICDLVRHVAGAFGVDEDDVWDWVDKERHSPTTKITRPS